MSSPVEFSVETSQRSQAIDITDRVESALASINGGSGVNVWIPHTTAGITVNESADPNVMSDMIDRFEKIIPWDDDYDHIEDNAAAHIKSQLLGSHQWLPVSDSTLNLGRWQGVFLLEWDGPRTRTVQIHNG